MPSDTDSQGPPTGGSTSPEFWEEWWSARRSVNPRALRAEHHFYGTRGVLVRALEPLLERDSAASICEFGGGGGGLWLLALARRLRASATCLDYSATGLEVTRRAFEAAGREVETVLADLLTHDFAGRRFDLIVHFGLVEHFGDPAAVFAKTAEALAPGGRTVFSVPNLLAYGARWWRAWAPENWSRHTVHTDAFIAERLEASGLRLCATKCFGGPMFRMARWEQPGALAPLVTLAHRVSRLGERVTPGLWVNTPCRYAKHRLFAAAPLDR